MDRLQIADFMRTSMRYWGASSHDVRNILQGIAEEKTLHPERKFSFRMQDLDISCKSMKEHYAFEVVKRTLVYVGANKLNSIREYPIEFLLEAI